LFEVPRLAAVYDALDSDRSDLEEYAALLERLSVSSMVDIGCGTGTFAILLASRGVQVTAVDPAEASLAVARAKPGGTNVNWLLGEAHSFTLGPVDAVTMTGNVAQVFLTDDAWDGLVGSAFKMLRPGGYLIFETRDPEAKAWQTWRRDATYRQAEIDGVGAVACWEELTSAELPLVSFRTTFEFGQDESVISESTLRFRGRDEVVASLRDAGFDAPDIRGAADRPNLELVFVARRPT
jgi:SAM-dependent methyltransferase